MAGNYKSPAEQSVHAPARHRMPVMVGGPAPSPSTSAQKDKTFYKLPDDLNKLFKTTNDSENSREKAARREKFSDKPRMARALIEDTKAASKHRKSSEHEDDTSPRRQDLASKVARPYDCSRNSDKEDGDVAINQEKEDGEEMTRYNSTSSTKHHSHKQNHKSRSTSSSKGIESSSSHTHERHRSESRSSNKGKKSSSRPGHIKHKSELASRNKHKADSKDSNSRSTESRSNRDDRTTSKDREKHSTKSGAESSSNCVYRTHSSSTINKKLIMKSKASTKVSSDTDYSLPEYSLVQTDCEWTPTSKSNVTNGLKQNKKKLLSDRPPSYCSSSYTSSSEAEAKRLHRKQKHKQGRSLLHRQSSELGGSDVSTSDCDFIPTFRPAGGGRVQGMTISGRKKPVIKLQRLKARPGVRYLVSENPQRRLKLQPVTKKRKKDGTDKHKRIYIPTESSDEESIPPTKLSQLANTGDGHVLCDKPEKSGDQNVPKHYTNLSHKHLHKHERRGSGSSSGYKSKTGYKRHHSGAISNGKSGDRSSSNRHKEHQPQSSSTKKELSKEKEKRFDFNKPTKTSHMDRLPHVNVAEERKVERGTGHCYLF